ncbi:hypothetical protein [Bradyrhizobium septentrionale]|uniref:Uncharacterized protein n=1 Tax=Bradyrhizobium septentrionale TaxID=1404411 RepID=A0ABZ2P704_9BRAD
MDALIERLHYVNHLVWVTDERYRTNHRWLRVIEGPTSSEKIREHRQRLLDNVQTLGVPGFKPSVLSDTLREELQLIEAALARFDDDRTVPASDEREDTETKAAGSVVDNDGLREAESDTEQR